MKTYVKSDGPNARWHVLVRARGLARTACGRTLRAKAVWDETEHNRLPGGSPVCFACAGVTPERLEEMRKRT